MCYNPESMGDEAIPAALKELSKAVERGEITSHTVLALTSQILRQQRLSWDARCHFCNGPSYPWVVSDEIWAQVSPVLGYQQACFECFAAAWQIMGLSKGEPLEINIP